MWSHPVLSDHQQCIESSKWKTKHKLDVCVQTFDWWCQYMTCTVYRAAVILHDSDEDNGGVINMWYQRNTFPFLWLAEPWKHETGVSESHHFLWVCITNEFRIYTQKMTTWMFPCWTSWWSAKWLPQEKESHPGSRHLLRHNIPEQV